MKAKDYRERARQKIKGHWGIAVGAAFIAALLGANGYDYCAGQATSTTQQQYAEYMGLAQTYPITTIVTTIVVLALIFIFFLIGSCLAIGQSRFFLDLGEEGKSPTIGTLFSYFKIWGKSVGLRLFVSIFVGLWTLLLVVPGIIAAIRYSQASYYLAEDPNIGIREAVNKSKTVMKGRCGAYFCLCLSFIGWILLSVITFGILLLWIQPYMQAATAAFHIDITQQPIQEAPQAPQAA